MSIRDMIADLGNLAKDNRLTNRLFRYNSIYYKRAAKTFRRIQEQPETGSATSAEMLSRTLRWARATEYGRKFGPHLADWPILSKDALLESPERFRRRVVFSVPAATGGSSGRPLRLWRSLECIAAEQATIDSLFGNTAPPMIEQKVAVLRADYVKDPADQAPPFGVWRNRGRWLVLSNAHLSRTTLPWFLDALTSFQPDLLWVYPTALSNLMHLAQEAGEGFSVPVVLSSSEMMSASLFHHTAEAFNARVIDRYGHGERVCSAHCDADREYRFHRAYGHVELIPVAGDSDPTTPLTARIIATGYWNSAFPLVRYDTGDRAILPASTDASSLDRIARGIDPFLGVVGRTDDYVVGRNGEIITGMNHIPRELDSVLRIQIVQEEVTRVRMLVQSRGELTSHDRQKLEANARELLPPYMDLRVEPVDKLISLPNGKTPFIIRRVPEDTSQQARS